MPGILPMKVIKVGTTSQSRIAQACDRCRSKKIRCDGIRPCCSQCSNVGFECKTSDKLSRRAFPRGYTESLEERVRILEGEVRELKDLLDEKDEKIDMLSKMHSNRRGSSSASSLPSMESRELSPPKEDIFRIQASPLLLGSETSDSYFMGASSGRAFVDSFKRKVQESGKSLSGFNTDAFLNAQCESTKPSKDFSRIASIPPRMFSDRCVNVFFQEWAPLFPVLHKSTFLRLYEDYSMDPEAMTDSYKLAQLHLVFGIAGSSSDNPDKTQIAHCENQWRIALNSLLMDNTLATLQCLILASLYCITKGDYKSLSLYKGIAVTLALRLGLHQSQKRFSFGALTTETRKKVFWSLYTIDCFSAALLGLPQLLKEDDIHCEYPTDIDDEYVTEKGFLPTLPGESSKISSALALFRVSRILSRVLERNYPAAASHDLSLQSLSLLEAELNEWSDNLPTHLKLTFVQDKPSTDITGNRSALLSLAYYYIRTLIHRPAVGSTLGSKSSSSVISLAESSKHIIQIVQLLEERSMSFSFCVNKNEMLTLCGLSLLYQGLDLKQEGKLMKDGQRFIGFVAKYLEKFNAPGAADFRRLATSMIPVETRPTLTYRHSSDHKMHGASTGKPASSSSSRKQVLQPSSKYSAIASANEADLLQQQEKLRRATLPNLVMQGNRSSISVNSRSDSPRRSHESHRSSTSSAHTPIISKHRTTSEKASSRPNLDYLSLSNTPAASGSESPKQPRQSFSQTPNYHTPSSVLTPPSASQTQNQKMSSVSPDEWASLLSSLDAGQSNIYDAVYGGPSLSLHQAPSNSSTSSADMYSHAHPHALPPSSQSLVDTNNHWSPDSWDMTALSMQDFDLGLTGQDGFSNPGPAHSVLSFSEESLSSGDDLSSDFIGSGNGSGRQSFDYNLPLGHVGNEGYMLEGVGLDGNFRL